MAKGGRASGQKGWRAENQIVKLFRKWGLSADRVALSGSKTRSDGTDGHDVDVWPWLRCNIFGKPNGSSLSCEVKSRKEHPKQLVSWLADNDILALKADRQEYLFVVPERVMRELLTGETE